MAADRNMKILVVDDFATMRRIVKNILKQLGFENIIEADDGTTALAKLKTDSSVEFVVTDWNMPKMTGIQLLETIRAGGDGGELEHMKDIPVLMVMEEALQEDIIAIVKAGVNNYIIRPFAAKTLAEKIDKIFP